MLSTLKKMVIVLLILVIGIPACTFGYFYHKLNSIHETNSDTNNILNDTKYCYYWRTENQSYHELPPHTCLSDHR